MSQRSAVQRYAGHAPAHNAHAGHVHSGHVHPGHDGLRAQPKLTKPQTPEKADKSGWTLGHAGRQVRVGPVAFWTIVGSLVLMAGWSAMTATYFAFRDDVLTRLLARQAQMQFAYEDRIAELRGQVDRLASRQLLDQEQFESKLDQLARRQALLESRNAALSGLPDPAPTGSLKPAMRGSTPPVPAPVVMPKPSPINDTVILVPPPEREARLESRTPLNAGTRLATLQVNGGLDGALARLQIALDRFEGAQVKSLNALEESFESKARKMRNILADLGLDTAKIAPATASRASGGPFVPASAGNISAFDRQLYRIRVARGNVDRLSRTLSAVPIRKPMTGDLEATSGFGMRTDPFLRAPAMHTGLDFRADTGEPARATAAGTVTVAGWSGG